ncbi:MAG: glycosyl hydrolase, partial [Myxococcota bacterium]
VLDVLGPQDHETRLVAVLLGKLGAEREGTPVLEDMRVLATADPGRQIDWEIPGGSWRIFALYENSTEHFVMGGAFPGEEADARVVDHLSTRGADALLEGYADPIMSAVAEGGVREVFVDSFELMGELPSTPDFLGSFREIAGYDLTPHLPLVFRRGGESKYGEMMDLFGRTGGPIYATPDPLQAVRIREDYEAVRRKLFEEQFVDRFVGWAHARGLELRLQAHGGYGDYLDTYARADVPESEALFGGGSFDFLKLASSAAHVADRRWASSESFITLRLFGTHLSDEEMRLLAGRAYSAGINRLAFHGVPYPYERADGKDWYPFSGGFGRILAGPLPMSSQLGPDQLLELPAFNRFLARLSVAMSHGEPVADVAWLRAEPIFPDEASLQLGRIEPHAGESEVTQALRARGLVHDRVSRRMLAGATPIDGGFEVGARRYRALLVDPLGVAEPGLVEKIATLAEKGVPVLTLGILPRRAPGLRDAENRDPRVLTARNRLVVRAIPVPDAAALEPALARHVRSTLVEPPAGERLSVSLERRRSPAGDILLAFNESWSPQKSTLRFTRAGGALIAWDPHTGEQSTLREAVQGGDPITLDFEPAETKILTLGRPATGASDRGDSPLPR